jgi:hypothetical protein
VSGWVVTRGVFVAPFLQAADIDSGGYWRALLQYKFHHVFPYFFAQPNFYRYFTA